MNESLPIASFKETIVSAVRDHPVVIITAETGAGKSTQVPQFLLQAGYTMVVTQPRRLAARTVSERVAEEIGCEFGGTVGFRTAYERQDSGATECLFCTDGLALVRELMGAGRHQVLVIDEVHEWNLNIEVLVAWAKLQLGRGANFKVVVMSATLEADKLSEFFGGAPVITVPGRMFPVEVKVATARDDAGETIALLQAGRNVLIFEPGKREIGEVAELIRQSGVSAEIIPLHGELEPAEQAKAFRQYSRPKCVIATNVAETSVTINDIDAVVDSGMERRIEVVDGVEGLYLRPISHANATQRKGRAGRCKPGIYVDRCSATDRPEFPVAEILRSRLDQTVLRLAEAGFDMEELEFFHQLARSEIHEAKRALKALGCMDESGRVTPVGRQVSRLPISVQYARMIVEADRLGVVDDVVTIAAILEQDGITARPKDKYETPKWWALCAGEQESDLMAQFFVWKRADGMRPDEMRENGVHVKAFFQAKEKRRHIAESLRGRVRDFRSNGRRENILRAVCAGMVDHLYQHAYGDWKNGDGQVRQLNRDSIVRSAGEWLVGLPFDLEIETRRGKMTLHLITMATKVLPAWLVEIAPHLVKLEQGLNPSYDPQSDCCLSTCKTVFNGQVVSEVREATPDHPEAVTVLARWLSDRASTESTALDVVLRSNAARQERASRLNIRTGKETFKIYSPEEMFERFVTALSGARRIVEVARLEVLALPLLDETTVARVLTESPDKIVIFDQETAVSYRQGCPPLVQLDFRGSRKWLSLPDAGIYLPSGREVTMCAVIDGYDYYIEAPSSQFKTKAREYLNQKLWSNWQRPELPAPTDSIPFVEMEYGRCAVAGEPLLAYGTLSYDSWYGSWKSFWSGSRAETERVYAQACTKFAEMKKVREADTFRRQPKTRPQRHAVPASSTPKPVSSGNFGLGADAWGKLDGLKF